MLCSNGYKETIDCSLIVMPACSRGKNTRPSILRILKRAKHGQNLYFIIKTSNMIYLAKVFIKS